jgi:hypothetical protein
MGEQDGVNTQKPVKHGTLHAYTRRKCRCEVCVTEMRRYHRERLRELGEVQRERQRGYQHAYYLRNREKLREAHREAARRQRARMKAERRVK